MDPPVMANGSQEQSETALEVVRAKGVPLAYEDLLRSQIYNPADVPARLSKPEAASLNDSKPLLAAG
ncbi:hypothetical protein HaLaN_25052 [Haematococcus lacustris]|uniref:Uncharacterized protein n=1 Tax=Haematococcus lacustris TaxID=44745 RepID=A0A6A0A3L9_HAELA|nr:hypothetical protein HaLaN_25052 [Haematococcus lacustris]